MQERYKVIDSRTRETLAASIGASGHTQAERFAQAMFPSVHTVASLLRPDITEKPKKRTKKR